MKDWLLDLLQRLPTTALQSATGVGMFIATGVVTLVRSEVPGGGLWVTAVLAMAGIGTVQHLGKRATWKSEAPNASSRP